MTRHIFFVTGLQATRSERTTQSGYQMKAQARSVLETIPSANWRVKVVGVNLRRKDVVLGKHSEHRKKDGVRPLVSWMAFGAYFESGQQVWVDLAEARAWRAETWIVPLVRETIKRAGWTIVKEVRQ